MAAVLSSPTPSFPSSSKPLVTPPLLGSPELSPDHQHERDGHSHPTHPPTASADTSNNARRSNSVPISSSPSSSSSASGGPSEPSTPTSSISSGSGASHSSSLVPAYPYNVAMAPAAFSGGPLPDDMDVTTRLPSICVDYLSHDWAEDDVWTSWKAMTRHKSEIANGVRLENASWRTWAKQRGKLKTVSPETLNWLKDSDVTWLYGPLHTAVDAVPPPKVATANDRLGLESLRPLDASKSPSPSKKAEKKEDGRGSPVAATPTATKAPPSPTPTRAPTAATGARLSRNASEGGGTRARKLAKELKTKPILKYRSLSDILMPQAQPTSPDVEQLSMDFEDQSTISVHHARSDSHLVRLNSLNRRTKRSSPVHSPGSSSPERSAASDSSSASNFLLRAQRKKDRRHISFNHRVEQCIAIDSSEDARTYSTQTSSDSEDDDDDDDVLTFGARSPRQHPFARPPAPKVPHTIARLGPTTLKSVELYPAPSPAVVFSSDPTEYDEGAASPPGSGGSFGQEHVETAPYGAAAGGRAPGPDDQARQQQQAAGRRVMYDYSSPGSAMRSQWDAEDEDDYAMGFDYFTGAAGAGPDVGIGDEYDMAQYGSTHLIGGSHNNYRGGTVSESSSYLGGGPYSPNSPYHPGSGTLDPQYHATTSSIPHYRDTLPSSSSSQSPSSSATTSTTTSPSSSSVQVASVSQRGPYNPAPTSRESNPPRRSALKGGRSREASVDSTASSASTSPSNASAPSPPLAASSPPVGIQAVATAIPAHVRPSIGRHSASFEENERGRSASRGSSSSLEREGSSRRGSSSISPTSYSPPNASYATAAAAARSGGSSAGAAGGAAPIAIQPSWMVGSYDSLSSVMNSRGAYGLPDVPESASESPTYPVRDTGAGNLSPPPASSGVAAGLGRIVTSSSVDSMGSLGSFGAGPVTPTSPTFGTTSPARRYQSLGAATDDEDDDARVEDIDAVPATVDDSAEVKKTDFERRTDQKDEAKGRTADRPSPIVVPPKASVPPAPVSPPIVTSPASPSPPPPSASTSTGLGHQRTSSGPRLRNPSPSTATTTAVAEQSAGSDSIGSGSSSGATSTPTESDSSGGGNGMLKRSPSSSSLSYARQSLLRAARASSDRDDSASRSSMEGSLRRASSDSSRVPQADHDYQYGADDDELNGVAGGVGAGINVAGTARDLLGAISKGIWGSLGRSNR
ncbi:hypothetical protein NBRC10513_003240 [Rhodotorula toruloides]|uniref:Proteophosphoglycan ppg4 n=1 Tax=Rhodotorula toruloides TaxID=5286 RepID=A0A2S9ZX09_RHOTO|nr:Proteophosphoglycan ppg4 [Rhodotorula toruloides]